MHTTNSSTCIAQTDKTGAWRNAIDCTCAELNERKTRLAEINELNWMEMRLTGHALNWMNAKRARLNWNELNWKCAWLPLGKMHLTENGQDCCLANCTWLPLGKMRLTEHALNWRTQNVIGWIEWTEWNENALEWKCAWLPLKCACGVAVQPDELTTCSEHKQNALGKMRLNENALDCRLANCAWQNALRKMCVELQCNLTSSRHALNTPKACTYVIALLPYCSNGNTQSWHMQYLFDSQRTRLPFWRERQWC